MAKQRRKAKPKRDGRVSAGKLQATFYEAAGQVVADHSIEIEDSTIDTPTALYTLEVLGKMAQDLGLSTKDVEQAKARVLMPVNVDIVWPKELGGPAIG